MDTMNQGVAAVGDNTATTSAAQPQPAATAPQGQPQGQPQADNQTAQPVSTSPVPSTDESGESPSAAPDLADMIRKDPSTVKALEAFQRFSGMPVEKAVQEMRKPEYKINPAYIDKIVTMFGGQDHIDQISRQKEMEQKKQEAQLKGEEKLAEFKAQKQAEKDIALPEDKKLAQALASGKMVSLYKVVSMRSDRRARIFDMASDINSDFNPEEAENKVNVWKDWNTSRGKPFQQRQSANVLFEHIGDAIDANNEYARRFGGDKTDLVSKPMNWWAQHAANDPVLMRLRAAIEPVKDEFMTFLQNNHALTEQDKQTGNLLLNDKLTPAYLTEALIQFSKTAAIRLREMDETGWQPAFNNQKFPALLTPTAAAALKKINNPELNDIFKDSLIGGTLTNNATGGGSGGIKYSDFGQQAAPQSKPIPTDANMPQGAKAMRDPQGNYAGYSLDGGKTMYRYKPQGQPQGQ